MSDSQHRRDNLIAVFVLLEPWDFLPPRMPDRITDDLRRAWFQYVRLWSDLRAAEGIEADEESIGELWRLYGHLRALGVRFDENFDGEMQELGRLASNIDSDLGPEYDDPMARYAWR